jgi:hypothetical protein
MKKQKGFTLIELLIVVRSWHHRSDRHPSLLRARVS